EPLLVLRLIARDDGQELVAGRVVRDLPHPRRRDRQATARVLLGLALEQNLHLLIVHELESLFFARRQLGADAALDLEPSQSRFLLLCFLGDFFEAFIYLFVLVGGEDDDDLKLDLFVRGATGGRDRQQPGDNGQAREPSSDGMDGRHHWSSLVFEALRIEDSVVYILAAGVS